MTTAGIVALVVLHCLMWAIAIACARIYTPPRLTRRHRFFDPYRVTPRARRRLEVR